MNNIWIQNNLHKNALRFLFLIVHILKVTFIYLKNLNYVSKKLNPYSWNRNASVIYIDNPVGTGFSFTEAQEGYPNFVNQSSEELFKGLQQFFQLLPEYKDR